MKISAEIGKSLLESENEWRKWAFSKADSSFAPPKLQELTAQCDIRVNLGANF
jgi:hypothetical protein